MLKLQFSVTDPMSTLKVDTLQDASGANPSTTAQIQQGRAKVWVAFNGIGTIAIVDSFNVSSLTDNGVGDWSVNFTTPTGSIGAVVTGMTMSGAAAGLGVDIASVSTSVTRVRLLNAASTFFDTSYMAVAVLGD